MCPLSLNALHWTSVIQTSLRGKYESALCNILFMFWRILSLFFHLGHLRLNSAQPIGQFGPIILADFNLNPCFSYLVLSFVKYWALSCQILSFQPHESNPEPRFGEKWLWSWPQNGGFNLELTSPSSAIASSAHWAVSGRSTTPSTAVASPRTSSASISVAVIWVIVAHSWDLSH